MDVITNFIMSVQVNMMLIIMFVTLIQFYKKKIKHRAMVVEKDDEVANCVIVQSKKKVHAQRKRRSEVLCGTPGCNRIAWHCMLDH